MRRYLLPLVVCTALGALFVLWWRGRDVIEPRPLDKGTKEAREDAGNIGRRGADPAKTRTGLAENEWLRELERALGRKDLSRAHWFRQKLCEDIDAVMADERLARNLLQLIRENATTDDLKRRDVVIPMLRVIEHPDATNLIEELYYTAKNDDERITLLSAMAREHHDAGRAKEWMVERALNSEEKKHREAAGYVIYHYVVDNELMVDVAGRVYASTGDTVQANRMIEAIATRAPTSPRAQEFLRKRLNNPRPSELNVVTIGITTWGNEDDAARLEQLANEFPRDAHVLRSTAIEVRGNARKRALGLKARKEGREFDPNEIDKGMAKELEELEKQERARKEAAEREKANGGG